MLTVSSCAENTPIGKHAFRTHSSASEVTTLLRYTCTNTFIIIIVVVVVVVVVRELPSSSV